MCRVSAPGVVLLLGLLLSGCSSRLSKPSSAIFKMGEPVQVGPLIYTILDSEWLDQLGEASNARTPHQRFLSIRLSVTNSGASVSGVPSLQLVDSRGKTYEELSDADGLPEWLGYLRMVEPAQTERGSILFDAPLGAYRLRLTDDADLENERVALVDVPLQLGPAVPAPPSPSTPE